MLGAAQGIEIKGTVKDASAAAIAGVLVKLDKRDYTTTSGTDGSFTLNDKSTGITGWEGTNPSAMLSASVGRGSLWIQVSETAEVTVTSLPNRLTVTNRATPAYCNYNGMENADSLKRFGRLYNWHIIKTGKLAPEGWRVPSEADWMAL